MCCPPPVLRRVKAERLQTRNDYLVQDGVEFSPLCSFNRYRSELPREVRSTMVSVRSHVALEIAAPPVWLYAIGLKTPCHSFRPKSTVPGVRCILISRNDARKNEVSGSVEEVRGRLQVTEFRSWFSNT